MLRQVLGKDGEEKMRQQKQLYSDFDRQCEQREVFVNVPDTNALLSTFALQPTAMASRA